MTQTSGKKEEETAEEEASAEEVEATTEEEEEEGKETTLEPSPHPKGIKQQEARVSAESSTKGTAPDKSPTATATSHTPTRVFSTGATTWTPWD